MAYRFQVDEGACINCGICMDLCPVRCLDMTRPQGQAGAPPSPIPFGAADEPTMMAMPVQIAACSGRFWSIGQANTKARGVLAKQTPTAAAVAGDQALHDSSKISAQKNLWACLLEGTYQTRVICSRQLPPC